MKRLLPLFLLLLIISCEQKSPEPIIQEDVTLWKQLNRVPMDYPVPGHETNYRTTYINEKGLQAVQDDNGTIYPEDTIIAKVIHETMKSDSTRVKITGMLKKPDHPQSQKGWVWFVKNLSSGEEQIISGSMCITCHETANNPHPYGWGNEENLFRDYTFFYDTP